MIDPWTVAVLTGMFAAYCFGRYRGRREIIRQKPETVTAVLIRSVQDAEALRRALDDTNDPKRTNRDELDKLLAEGRSAYDVLESAMQVGWKSNTRLRVMLAAGRLTGAKPETTTHGGHDGGGSVN